MPPTFTSRMVASAGDPGTGSPTAAAQCTTTSAPPRSGTPVAASHGTCRPTGPGRRPTHSTRAPRAAAVTAV